MRAELPGAAGAVVAHSSLRFGDDRKYLLLFTSPDDDAYNTKISEDLRGLAARRGVLAKKGGVLRTCGSSWARAQSDRHGREKSSDVNSRLKAA